MGANFAANRQDTNMKLDRFQATAGRGDAAALVIVNGGDAWNLRLEPSQDLIATRKVDSGEARLFDSLDLAYRFARRHGWRGAILVEG